MISSIIASVALASMALPPGGPAPASYGGGYGDRASALWMFPPEAPGAGRDFVFTEVYQGINNSGPAGRAVVGLGVCIDQEYEGVSSEVCRGAGFGHDLVPGEFETSPLQDLAQLDYEDSGGRQQVEWRANGGSPEAAPHYATGARGAAADLSTSRGVTAEGWVLGRPVDDTILKAARVARTAGGGGAVSNSDFGGYRVEQTVDGDGRYRVTLYRAR